MKHVLMIDAPHGGADPGAAGNGIIEKDYVLTFCNSLLYLLEDTWVEPHISRVEDHNISLDHPAIHAAEVGAKFAISIHVNAFEDTMVHGAMAFHLAGDAFGLHVASSIVRDLPPSMMRRDNRPIKAVRPAWRRVCNVLEPFWARNIPSCLVELGFCSNPGDANLLGNPATRAWLLSAIVSGVERLKSLYPN